MSETDRDIEQKEKEIKQLFEDLRPDENEIPKRVDQAVLASIREKGTESEKANNKTLYFWFSAVATSAAAVFIISMSVMFSRINAKAPEQPDIVDLYVLNRELNSNKKVSDSWDADNNGAVDGKDIDQLAQMIVKID